MNRSLFHAALLLGLLIAAPHRAQAVAIELADSTKTVTVGVPFTLQLKIFDVSALLDPPLQSFDVEIAFSQTGMQFEGAQFGDPNLGDQLNFSGLADLSITPPFASGIDQLSVRIAEVSNDLSIPLQPGEFVLATLTFRALAAGTSQIGVLDAQLLGFDGGYSQTFLGASNISAVPEADCLLWLLAALGLAGLRAPQTSRNDSAAP
jgi:hypothetical protein